jgi:hypothetical protein
VVIKFCDTTTLFTTMGSSCRAMNFASVAVLDEAIFVAENKLAHVVGVRREDGEVASFEEVEFLGGEFVRTGEVARVGETDTEVGPDQHNEENGVDDENGDGC